MTTSTFAQVLLRRGCYAGTTTSGSGTISSSRAMARSSPITKLIAARGMASLSRSTTTALRMTAMVGQGRHRSFLPVTHRPLMHHWSCPTTVSSLFQSHVRCFQSVALYHEVADSTLESIQDALDALFESMPPQHNNSSSGSGGGDFEVSYASGVLTIVMPPHGTWVLNKQTPNQQIWWSSPLSGPRRYEYENDQWVYTRSDGIDGSSVISLGQTLKDEIRQLYQLELDLEDVK